LKNVNAERNDPIVVLGGLEGGEAGQSLISALGMPAAP
jgi:hypothetical protein